MNIDRAIKAAAAAYHCVGIKHIENCPEIIRSMTRALDAWEQAKSERRVLVIAGERLPDEWPQGDA